MGTPRIVSGSVKTLLCRSCDSTIPMFAFEGEEDIDTIGLASAGSCGRPDLVVVEATPDEWRNISLNDVSALESRIADESGRSDFRVLTVLRVEKGAEPPPGISFAEFRKYYRPPILVYRCPCCSTGEAVESSELAVDDFKKIGGHVFVMGNLVLEGGEPDLGTSAR